MLLVLAVLLMCYRAQATKLNEEYTLPYTHHIHNTEEELYDINLGRDSYSGCACKHSSTKWIVCFGQERCVRLPKEIKLKEKSFMIRTSNIANITKGEFKNYGYLTHLEIEANYKLDLLEENCFQELDNLRNLSISYNPRIEKLSPNTFNGLVNLRELVLTRNGLTNVQLLAQAFSHKNLPKLTTLILDQNPLRQIQEFDFDPLQGSPLEKLSLSLCQLDYIHPNSLNSLKNLRILRLGLNSLNESVITDLMESLVENNIPIAKLSLYEVGFRKNPPRQLLEVIARSNITNLSLAGNQFEQLTNASFIRMPNIRVLDLRDAKICDICSDTFTGFPNLETLLLSKNKLSCIPNGILLSQLKYLDLSYNDVEHDGYLNVGTNKFEKMSNLWGLNLSYNNMRVLVSEAFVGLINLEILSLKNASLFQIKDGVFVPLNLLKYLDLENNPISSDTPFNKNTFVGLERLEFLLLGGCSLTKFNTSDNPFEVLTSLRYLSLERNNIAKLSGALFLPLSKLTDINISQNFLSSWQERLFQNSTIEHIQAHQNKFTTITEAMRKDFAYIKDIDMTSNPFNCDCALVYSLMNVSFRKYNASLLSLLKTEAPYCTAPSHYSNMSIVSYYDMAITRGDLCNIPHTNIVVLYVTFLIFVIAIMVLAICYKYRWHIRYWIFLTKIAIIRKGKVLQRSRNLTGKHYQFDAFVSYSNEDRRFIVNLISMLENNEPFLKLCVYERDFQIGEVISESVLESVAKSRKTLLVVSNSYVKSHWCRWEAQVAENYRLFFQNENGDLVNDSIVIIKLGRVHKNNMTPMLKYLLKTRVYLQWDTEYSRQKEFWKKLRTFLAPPSRHEETDPCIEI